MTDLIENIEEQTYEMIDLLREENNKTTRSQATKLLLKISQAIQSNHESLKQEITLQQASSRSYLSLYNGIMQGERLFELQAALKRALCVEEITKERIEATQKEKRPKFPIRRSSDRYNPPKRKMELKQMELFL